MGDSVSGQGSSRSSRVAPWLLFGTALALVVFRAPRLLLEPRFWAEEGSIYFATAWRAPWLESVFHLHSAGYLLLSASLPATCAARLLPLEWAPAATTAAALAVLATALAIVAFGRSYLWDSPLRRALACAVLLFAPSNLGEVWLNSTNSQVYCGVVSLCILCEDLRGASRRRVTTYALLLLGCGLSGPYTSFLLPAFGAKLALERSGGAWITGGMVAATAAVQVLAFGQVWRHEALDATRFERLDWVRSATYTFYQQFLIPLGARPWVRAFGDPAAVLGSLAREPRAPLIVAIALLGLLGAGLVVALAVDRDVRSPRNLLVISLASLALLTTVSAKFGRTTGRYAVVSGIALLLLLLAHARFAAGAPLWRPALAAGLLAWALAVGALDYRRDEAFRCPGECPRWRAEVARWRAEPGYAPQIWPVRLPREGPQWRVVLGER